MCMVLKRHHICRAFCNMFRRALAFFCLPCGRETDTEDLRVVAVCDDDAEPELLYPQDTNVVWMRFRLGPGQEEGIPPMSEEPQKMLTSAGAADVCAEKLPWLQDTQQDERTVGKVNDATIISTVAVVHSTPDDGASSEEEVPPPARRRRGCRRCWAERLGAKVVVLPHGRQGYRLNRR
ncbi:uncharacterized protein LOC126266888 [Schistocerca gregaria]|uniref:uncharacterized protein LOC126266888 n=1 Tax=Schistocerca gregaria TaxID=7010 RepID=UPI00211E2E4E|nr:uncharacterized protein LOC126266888 [Schistocerca gregaria]